MFGCTVSSELSYSIASIVGNGLMLNVFVASYIMFGCTVSSELSYSIASIVGNGLMLNVFVGDVVLQATSAGTAHNKLTHLDLATLLTWETKSACSQEPQSSWHCQVWLTDEESVMEMSMCRGACRIWDQDKLPVGY